MVKFCEIFEFLLKKKREIFSGGRRPDKVGIRGWRLVQEADTSTGGCSSLEAAHYLWSWELEQKQLDWTHSSILLLSPRPDL